ncbi:MAG: HAD-IIIA family hydrolase [Clostridiaceae bacterium]|nr:HAD-IIIA family hydrolase [Lachnospiraceae bacterium]MCI9485361.1 HAD-IIIA family hydrolase [Clostridiaceae bacterium]
MSNWKQIKYLIIDVDGTMTDAGIYYDEHGNELKKFCTKDAAGFFAAHKAGIQIMVLTGRECAATTRRMTEMKVDYLVQNCKDKITYLAQFMKEHQVTGEEMGYLGDDLNDLPSMKLCGFAGCPEDACAEVRERADYVSHVKGGYGAVRDIIEHLLRERGEWEKTTAEIYGIGI